MCLLWSPRHRKQRRTTAGTAVSIELESGEEGDVSKNVQQEDDITNFLRYMMLQKTEGWNVRKMIVREGRGRKREIGKTGRTGYKDRESGC